MTGFFPGFEVRAEKGTRGELPRAPRFLCWTKRSTARHPTFPFTGPAVCPTAPVDAIVSRPGDGLAIVCQGCDGAEWRSIR
jgi:hypothetical protein